MASRSARVERSIETVVLLIGRKAQPALDIMADIEDNDVGLLLDDVEDDAAAGKKRKAAVLVCTSA